MPTIDKIHRDVLLTNVSVKYKNDQYIADEVFPIVSVKNDSDLFRVYERDFYIPSTQRAWGAVSHEHDFDVSTVGYQVEWHSQKAYVPDQAARNYDLADLRADYTESLTDVVLRRKEVMVAAHFTTAGATPAWSLNVSLGATAAWDATTVVNPIQMFDTGAATIILNGGKKPNFAIIPLNAMTAFKHNAQVQERLKYVGKAATQEIVAGMIGVDKVLVPAAIYNTRPPGPLQVMSITSIWQQDCAFIGYRPNSPSPLEPSCGYTFQVPRSQVKRWRDDEREADAIEVSQEFVPKIVASLCGYQIRDVI